MISVFRKFGPTYWLLDCSCLLPPTSYLDLEQMSGMAVPGVYQVGGGGSLGHNSQQNGRLIVTNGATGSVPTANNGLGKDKG